MNKDVVKAVFLGMIGSLLAQITFNLLSSGAKAVGVTGIRSISRKEIK